MPRSVRTVVLQPLGASPHIQTVRNAARRMTSVRVFACNAGAHWQGRDAGGFTSGGGYGSARRHRRALTTPDMAPNAVPRLRVRRFAEQIEVWTIIEMYGVTKSLGCFRATHVVADKPNRCLICWSLQSAPAVRNGRVYRLECLETPGKVDACVGGAPPVEAAQHVDGSWTGTSY